MYRKNSTKRIDNEIDRCAMEYLQRDKIEDVVHLKPPEEEKLKTYWKLRKTVYGLKDAMRACSGT